MTLHSEHTRIRIAHEPADEPGIEVSLFATPREGYSEGVVSVYFGRTGFGQYGLQLAPRGARQLSMLLASFANIAEGIEAPPVPEPIDYDEVRCRRCNTQRVGHIDKGHPFEQAAPEPMDPLVHASAVEGTPYETDGFGFPQKDDDEPDVEVVEDRAQGSHPDPDAEGKV